MSLGIVSTGEKEVRDKKATDHAGMWMESSCPTVTLRPEGLILASVQPNGRSQGLLRVTLSVLVESWFG